MPTITTEIPTLAGLDLRQVLNPMADGALVVTHPAGGASAIGWVRTEGDLRLADGLYADDAPITESAVLDAIAWQMTHGSEWDPCDWPAEYLRAIGEDRLEDLPAAFLAARIERWGLDDPAGRGVQERVLDLHGAVMVSYDGGGTWEKLPAGQPVRLGTEENIVEVTRFGETLKKYIIF